MRSFEVQWLVEGAHKGKVGIFEDGKLIGIGSFGPDMRSGDREHLAILAESSSESRRILAELIRKRMMEFNESYQLYIRA